MIISFNISELFKVEYFLSKITKFNTNLLHSQISNCNLGGNNKELNNYYLFFVEF